MTRQETQPTSSSRYVFGPVPSRRLGQSLGIDPIPLKTCNWNCVYCQLGRTQPLTNSRRDYISQGAILEEVEQVLSSRAPGSIDWVTFVGSGEPVLHAGIGNLIRAVKALTEIPVAVITNGTLLDLPEVRDALLPADAVLPTLDAGGAEGYRKINRPHPDITFERHVQGLVAFRKSYQGRLWVEVMLVRDLNDTREALEAIGRVLDLIRPDIIHLNLPDRPPAEHWVQPPTDEGLMRALAILGNHVEVVHPAAGSFDVSGYDSPLEAIVSIVGRHPLRQSEIEQALGDWPAERIEKALTELAAAGRIQFVERYGTAFWGAAPSQYPEKQQSLRTKPRPD